ncbi:MAG: hypothetical protein HY898_29200 [Deltaproteobacteria bacterium]|nr:hypothetical protein [Deltaproteobacteria bacterium]
MESLARSSTAARRILQPSAALIVALLATAGIASCSDSSSADPNWASTKGGGAGQGGTGAGGSGAGGTAANGGTGGGAGTILIDGGGGAGDGAVGKGCEKIDFLFIVDNSESMQDNQAQLVAAFPGFISAIENTVNAGSNYHILVTDTDAWGRCNTANPWTGVDPTSSDCNSYIKKTVFEECDRTLGAGVVHPAGEFASNAVCPYPAGRRYLQQGDANVSAAFACAAQVGIAGNPKERPMDAMLAALSAQINGPGGCNEAFLREDALLVITFISDDPNYEDSGTPQEWYDGVVQAKKGDPNAVVVVGFTPAFDGCQDGKGPPKGSHWAEFVAKFPSNLHSSACGTDYASVFTQAVTVIDESCDKYVPPIQ